MKKLILLFLFPMIVCAKPGPVTQYLMNEPASLFDIAMIRLQHSMNYWEKQSTFNYRLKSQPDAFGNVNVQYRAEDDKIYVSFTAMDNSSTVEQMEAGCRFVMRQLRIYISKGLPKLFQHVSYRDPSEPHALGSAVNDMFEFRCYVSGDDSSEGRFWASQTLREEEMTIGRWPVFE